MVKLNGCVMPGMPAVPKNSAHTDQPNAARVPIDTSVSIVAAPWRRLIQAARWNGHPPYATTGAASARDSHCQLVNCNAGTIASDDHRQARTTLMQQPVSQRAEPVLGPAPASRVPSRPAPERRRLSAGPGPWRCSRSGSTTAIRSSGVTVGG